MQLIIPSSDPNLALTCLESIEERDPEFLERTLIVTDDPDAYKGIVMRWPKVCLLQGSKVFNFAGWINAGLLTTMDNDVSFFLLNDDTRLLTDNGLSLLEEIVERPGGLAILSAAIRGTSGVVEQRQVTPGSVRVLQGHIAFTAVAIRRDALDTLGLLDERFVGYGYEDNDFCQRADKAGLGIGVYDGCVFDHYKPHSTFGRSDNFKDMWLQNETLYWEKWSALQDAVVVVGGSRSGAAVVTAVVERLGYDMPDKPAPFEANVSAYYRDERLSRVVGKEYGPRNYIAGRNAQGHPWGTRIWPAPGMAIRFLESFATPPSLVFVIRDREAQIRSFVAANGVKYAEAARRIDQEITDQEQISAWAASSRVRFTTVLFENLIDNPRETVGNLAGWLNYDKSLSVPLAVVRPEFAQFGPGGQLREQAPPADFGKIAVGVRLTTPDPAFVGCYARLIRQGLRDGDVILEPAIRTPSHWAASNLMRRFLSSGCDTLLLLDDDMTFDPDLLNRLRDKPDNWRYAIVSALATQRIPPPRALVLRVGEQPPLPDALNGLYYDLLVGEVVAGETLPADGTGFAFTLIRREVIEKMTAPEGPSYTFYVQWGQGGEGEDVNFCRRAGSLGFRVAVDAAAHVGHVGSVVYGYEEFDQWRNTRTPTGLSVDKLVELVEAALPSLSGSQLETAVNLLRKAREK